MQCTEKNFHHYQHKSQTTKVFVAYITDVYVPDYSIRFMGSVIKIALLMFFTKGKRR